jgi:uncharacterized membrane protein
MTETPSGTVSSNRNVMIVLSYLWILCLVPLLTEKEDKEVQWHAKHGVVLMVAEILFWIAFTIVTNIIVAATLGLGCLVSLLGPFIALAFLAIHVMCIIKGINGQRMTIPYVTDFVQKF